MYPPMMRTKISVPRPRGDLYSRPRLLNQINEFLDNKLIMISAPAGYGKTTLLIDFASKAEIPVCWYSLDENDRDLIRFISHLVAAVGVRFPHFGTETFAVLKNYTDHSIDVEVVLTSMVNELYDKVSEHFLIVIDDFHLIEQNQNIVSFVSRLIEYSDENCHFVILSRTLLGLPNMPILVARNQVAGFSFEELVFRKNEIRNLFQKNYQVSLTKDELDSLFSESEGWITGLLMTATKVSDGNILKHRTSQVVGVGIDEYLGQQILETLSPNLKTFLFQTSLLEEFDLTLCKKVLDPVNEIQMPWEKLMEEALQRNLFLIAVPDEVNGTVFLRFHHLFRDFLQKRIINSNKTLADQIRLNLANYFSENAEWQVAGNILFAINQFEKVAVLLEKAGPDLIAKGKYDLISEWLSKLTGDIRYRHPVLLSLQGIKLVLDKDIHHGINALNEAINLLREDPEQRKILLQSLSRRATTYRMIGDLEACLHDIEEIEKLSSEYKDEYRVITNAHREKALVLFHKGEINDAIREMLKAKQILLNIGDDTNRFQFDIEIGMMQRALGNFFEAERNYLSALDYFEKAGNFSTIANLHNNLAFLYHKLGNYSKAMFQYEKTIEYARLSKNVRIEAYGFVGVADIYQEIHSFNESLTSYQKGLSLIEITQDKVLMDYIQIALVRLHLKQGLLDEAIYLFNEIDPLENSNIMAKFLIVEISYIQGKYQEALTQWDEFENENSNKIGFDDQAYIEFYKMLIIWKLKKIGIYDLSRLNSWVKNPKISNAVISAGKNFIVDLKKIVFPSETDQLIWNMILIKIENFGESIAFVKRRIRQHSENIPIPPAKFKIYSFGTPYVTKGEEEIPNNEWQANIAKEMLFYILHYPEGVSKEQISEALWSDIDDDLTLRFKNTIYRLRRVMGKDAILLENNRYFFNTRLDYRYDLEDFYNYLLTTPSEENLYKAVKLYKGDFLSGFNGLWILPERTRIHLMYRDAVVRLAETFSEKKKYSFVIDLVEGLLKIEPEFEKAYQILMQCADDMGDPKMIFDYYHQCEKILGENLQIEPSKETKELLFKLTH